MWSVGCSAGSQWTGKAQTPQNADAIFQWVRTLFASRMPKERAYRVLSAVDEYTREVHALHAARSIGAEKGQEVMRELIETHGAPGDIRSDNGPEFIAKSPQRWLAQAGIKTLYIEPGCPWQKGYVESFHD